MNMNEKIGKAVIILLFLIVIIPKLSQLLTGSAIRIFGFSLNDTVLLFIAIIAIIALILLLFTRQRADLSPSEKKFRKLYKPKSDLDRIRSYIKERTDAKDSKQKILFTLRKVGWDEDIIQTAFDTAGKARVIKIAPKKTIRRRKKRRIKKK